MNNYLSFAAFKAASARSPVVHATSVGIIHEGRRFWSRRLARFLGKRGKPVRYFIDPTGPWGECAIVISDTHGFVDTAPEVWRRLA